MSIEFPTGRNELTPARKAYFETRIWEEVDNLAETRSALVNRQEHIYSLLNDKSNQERDHTKRRQIEDEYWGIPDTLSELSDKETQLQELLVKLEDNTISDQELTQLFPNGEKEEVRISKAKQRKLEHLQAIKEGASGLIFGSIGFSYDLGHWDSGHSTTNPTRMTTGRHAKGIKGSFNSFDAASEFIHRTTDTHGGKVDYGKDKGAYYVTKTGKRIRKS